MNVLMISIDKTLLGNSEVGDAEERHKKYGEFLDNLDIIVYTNKKERYTKYVISDNVRSWPSLSLCKPFLIFNALRIAKIIKNRHKIDLIVCQDSCYLGFVGLLLKWKYNTKLVVDFHGDLWDNPYWIEERFINRFLLTLSHFVVKHADGIRTVSRRIKDKLVRFGINKDRISVIHAAVNTSLFQNINQKEVKSIRDLIDGRITILFAGRLVPIKNIPLLLHAFSAVASSNEKAVLLLVGEGPEKEYIESLIESLHLKERVFLLGAVPLSDMLYYYHAADMLVLPSFSEGLPRVLVEASSCGLPLISTDVSGAEDIIENEENGFLVPVDNAKVLAEKMLILLEDGELRTKMGKQSLRIIKNKNFGDTTHKLVDFWKNVLKNKEG